MCCICHDLDGLMRLQIVLSRHQVQYSSEIKYSSLEVLSLSELEKQIVFDFRTNMAKIPELSTHMVGTYVFTPATLPYPDSTRKQISFPRSLSPGLSQSLLKSSELFSLISTSSGWCLAASSHFCHHHYNDQQQLDTPHLQEMVIPACPDPPHQISRAVFNLQTSLFVIPNTGSGLVWKSTCNFGLYSFLSALSDAIRGRISYCRWMTHFGWNSSGCVL